LITKVGAGIVLKRFGRVGEDIHEANVDDVQGRFGTEGAQTGLVISLALRGLSVRGKQGYSGHEITHIVGDDLAQIRSDASRRRRSSIPHVRKNVQTETRV
jgi:hypothetical protein